MKHHFGDFLDRTSGAWKMTPNRDRYKYMMSNIETLDETVNTITVTKEHKNWEKIFDLKKLEELTIHNGNKEQLHGLINLPKLKRLRISHLRPKDIIPLENLINLEELVLEYVSGFSDLSPLKSLKKLRSIHFENLRRVSKFDGLYGIPNLKHLSIYGTLDWKQPIEDFEFIRGISNLEVYSSWQTKTKAEYPALLPFCLHKKIKKIKVTTREFQTSEYALLSEGKPNTNPNGWQPINIRIGNFLNLPTNDFRNKLSDEEIIKSHPEVFIIYTGERKISDPEKERFEFIGKRAGEIMCNHKNANRKCDNFKKEYKSMKAKARNVLNKKADNNR